MPKRTSFCIIGASVAVGLLLQSVSRLRTPEISGYSLTSTAACLTDHSTSLTTPSVVIDFPGQADDATARASELTFVQNLGQWNAEGAFVSRTGNLAIRVDTDVILLQRVAPDSRCGATVRLDFENASPT